MVTLLDGECPDIRAKYPLSWTWIDWIKCLNREYISSSLAAVELSIKADVVYHFNPVLKAYKTSKPSLGEKDINHGYPKKSM